MKYPTIDREDASLISLRKSDKSQVKLAVYQRKMVCYYNARVKKKTFQINDLVLWRVFLFSKEPGIGMLGLNWEDPYLIKKELRPSTYWIEDLGRKMQSRPWNIEHLRVYYH